MRCPNSKCGRETDRVIVTFRSSRKTGKLKKIEGCAACFHHQVAFHAYTGRKIWMGRDAYEPKKLEQMNMDWIERTKERAARNRRDTAYISPEAFNILAEKSKQGLIRTPPRRQ